ncbi:MAG: hypothetical protein P8I55_15180 [Crocinitomix sp.]|nr:hypothetical protein [Crocinitomix sp.]
MHVVAPIGFSLLTIFVVLVIAVTYRRALLRAGIKELQVFIRLVLVLLAMGLWFT